jgi:glycosyltransferase involved in cell wall biosynthesis
MSQHVLVIIGYVWPEPGSSAAGRHMMEIIQVFLSSGWQIIFATPAADSPHKADLQSMGIAEKAIELNSDSFDEWLATVSPDAVLFDRFMMEEQFGWRVARTCPQAMRILDTEDLHFLRQARQAAEKKNADSNKPVIKNETALREIASIYRSDLSLIISEPEMQLLSDEFQIPKALLHYFPFVMNSMKDEQPGFDQRKDFLFIGTVRHAPNLDAIRYLKNILWPKIRLQLPDADLKIVGSYLTKEVSQMHRPETGFHVLGHVEDLQPLLAGSRVYLAPLRFGAGLKGKLIEAMQWGIPSITTSTGAEGIAAGNDWPGVVTDDQDGFVEAAVAYYQSDIAWNKARQTGFDLLAKHFDGKRHIKILSDRLEELRQGLQQYRHHNFIGQMLMHHSMRSTEFMSRWIDCKNRKEN